SRFTVEYATLFHPTTNLSYPELRLNLRWRKYCATEFYLYHSQYLLAIFTQQ
ncbi:MAG: hypothetical protein RIS84_1766, partial [Pseudomonadota bacterium]